jgi:hypothetical protein
VHPSSHTTPSSTPQQPHNTQLHPPAATHTADLSGTRRRHVDGGRMAASLFLRLFHCSAHTRKTGTSAGISGIGIPVQAVKAGCHQAGRQAGRQAPDDQAAPPLLHLLCCAVLFRPICAPHWTNRANKHRRLPAASHSLVLQPAAHPAAAGSHAAALPASLPPSLPHLSRRRGGPGGLSLPSLGLLRPPPGCRTGSTAAVQVAVQL